MFIQKMVEGIRGAFMGDDGVCHDCRHDGNTPFFAGKLKNRPSRPPRASDEAVNLSRKSPENFCFLQKKALSILL
jgi:hypothetical protein